MLDEMKDGLVDIGKELAKDVLPEEPDAVNIVAGAVEVLGLDSPVVTMVLGVVKVYADVVIGVIQLVRSTVGLSFFLLSLSTCTTTVCPAQQQRSVLH